MNEYFTAEGHLTSYALQKLQSGEESELRRLEMTEHLAFCDECTEKYTAMLCDEALLMPAAPIAKNVLARIKAQARIVFFNRYIAAAVAACFAIMLWIGGAFDTKLIIKENNAIGQITTITESLTEKTTKLTNNFSDAINKIFTGISLKGVLINEKK
ncbi:MAG: hypothetical protein RR724_01920 [Hydrogenoanaerobacterium sp.]